MPKMKTHQGAKKRFKITGTGKLRREQQMRKHLLEHKSSRRKRRLDGEVDVHSGNVAAVKRQLGLR
jgi:large subunit ribosomal protein L35